MSKTSETPISNMNFETAYGELEKTIADLEEGELSLDDAINHYERGKLLTRHCQDLLDKAEIKIRTLSEGKANGEVENESG